ncbi:hypothetical protein APHNP_0806 [Anaplasma phagocytophilum str. ApNP]|uniref:Uncharacterized protein n=1 Tax=Anaplasma phagocytophilum str. ApNP TaxID=1359153 RepID=A0A0F3NF58_ANAPH|nr:hypothetical protein APHNP_0806 [Anaplasma phagocytophilum str. ApNP]
MYNGSSLYIMFLLRKELGTRHSCLIASKRCSVNFCRVVA